MFWRHRIAFAPSRKSYRIGLLFTHMNGCGVAISVTERSCAAPISKVERDISDRFCAILWCKVNTYSARYGSKYVGARTGTHWDGSKYSGVRTGIYECTKPSRPTTPARCLCSQTVQSRVAALHTVPDSFTWRLDKTILYGVNIAFAFLLT